MSLAMHVCARKNGLNLQALMAEAFDDVLRKYGKARSEGEGAEEDSPDFLATVRIEGACRLWIGSYCCTQ